MVWSHNDHWMMTGDHAGFVKYWQSNMNNVKMYQAHKDPIRGLRCVIVGKELVTLGQLLVYNFENFIINKIICTWWSMLSNSFHLLILNLQYYLWCTFLNHENFYFFSGNYIKKFNLYKLWLCFKNITNNQHGCFDFNMCCPHLINGVFGFLRINLDMKWLGQHRQS